MFGSPRLVFRPAFCHQSSTLTSAAVYRKITAARSILSRPIFPPRRDITNMAATTSQTLQSQPLTTWTRLVRYVSSKDSAIRYGEPRVPTDSDNIDQLAAAGQLEVDVLEGGESRPEFLDVRPTGEIDHVATLLGPLTVKDVPIVRCVGLNYRTHILETGFDLPQNPTLFTKPGTAIASTRSPIPIPPIAQSKCDYEGELTIIIGRACKNVSPANALDYVLGYTVGNDVSCRDWQMDKDKAGMMPQWSFSKSFDAYAPLGPCIVSPKLLGDASGLTLTTSVNGEERQRSGTADLVFGVREIVSFCSQGTTLQAGSCIMTGTPGGVGFAFKPPRFLQDGDEVAVEIGGIGRLVNTMAFEK